MLAAPPPAVEAPIEGWNWESSQPPPTRTTTIPATAGPRKRALLKMIALIAKAEGSAARLTRVGINARREGCATALKMPSSKVNASNSSIVIVPV